MKSINQMKSLSFKDMFKNKNLLFKEVDKGSATVLMDTTNYLAES